MSAAIVAAIAAGSIEWEIDPDFGYLVATAVPGIDDPHVLRPRLLYESQGRSEEYTDLVEELHADRRAHMAKYPDLQPEIANLV
jgi:phosphoenolpyruvate carboxykinase (ATP)